MFHMKLQLKATYFVLLDLLVKMMEAQWKTGLDILVKMKKIFKI